jgi:hypothetical protein
MIPDSKDALLRRKATAAALNEAGYPMSPATLATKASRGGEALAWAQTRLTTPRRSTSESDAAPAWPLRRGQLREDGGAGPIDADDIACALGDVRQIGTTLKSRVENPPAPGPASQPRRLERPRKESASGGVP